MRRRLPRLRCPIPRRQLPRRDQGSAVAAVGAHAKVSKHQTMASPGRAPAPQRLTLLMIDDKMSLISRDMRGRGYAKAALGGGMASAMPRMQFGAQGALGRPQPAGRLASREWRVLLAIGGYCRYGQEGDSKRARCPRSACASAGPLRRCHDGRLPPPPPRLPARRADISRPTRQQFARLPGLRPAADAAASGAVASRPP